MHSPRLLPWQRGIFMVGTTSEINRHVKLYHSANFHAGITFCTLSTKFAAMPLDYELTLGTRLGRKCTTVTESLTALNRICCKTV